MSSALDEKLDELARGVSSQIARYPAVTLDNCDEWHAAAKKHVVAALASACALQRAESVAVCNEYASRQKFAGMAYPAGTSGREDCFNMAQAATALAACVAHGDIDKAAAARAMPSAIEASGRGDG